MGNASKKQDPTIRIRTADLEILQRVSDNLSTPQIAVLGWAIKALADYHAHHRERMMLPLRFDETFKVYQMLPAPDDRLALSDPVGDESKPTRGAGAHKKTRSAR